MIEKLLEQYEAGALTASGFIPEALSEMNAANSDTILDRLPVDLRSELTSFVAEFESMTRPPIVFGNVRVLTPEQIKVARRWLDVHIGGFVVLAPGKT